ncbi:RDD family protein [Tunturiibacter lichenicola]|uniref:RDD family protein n=1 Tax=Tunturiibacter lichenicola TaxID=2051959 RepID=UPI003D9BAFF9
MSSAQRDLHPLDVATAETEAEAPFALKEQVAQRLAAHRARRNQQSGSLVTAIATPSPAKARSSRIAAAVAERYANSPSYRTFLAAQAETAIREAEATAEVAARSARAIADAQYELLAELDQWTLTPPTLPPAPTPAATSLPITEAPPFPTAATTSTSSPALTVRLYEDGARSLTEPTVTSARVYGQAQAQEAIDEEENLILDDEIAFRQAPVFESVGAPVEIPANLIEFPRQLVAPRKARPRLAEGPLREDADHAPATAQLRIFEVEADQISTAPVVESTAPEWSSILLAAHPVAAPVETAEAPFLAELPPQTAPLNLRLMATIVDGCVVTATLLIFIGVFAITVGKLSGPASPMVPQITLQTAAIGAAGTLAVLTLLYQLLFFTFSDATPGMRYARIGLCTFSDDNPTRSAMRRRIFAVILAACPLGIGFLWAWLDDDGLGWHDRISRMYQRSY